MDVEGRSVTVGVKLAADCEEEVESPRPRVIVSSAVCLSSWICGGTVAVPGRSVLDKSFLRWPGC
jgi:hypothetical protein